MTQYRYVGNHAQILESGQPIGPGEYVELADEDITGINKMLMDDDKFIDASDFDAGEAAPAAKPELRDDPQTMPGSKAKTTTKEKTE